MNGSMGIQKHGPVDSDSRGRFLRWIRPGRRLVTAPGILFILLFLLPFVLPFIGGSLSSLRAEGWQSSYETAAQRAKTDARPILLEFYATWCGYCAQMKKEIYSRPDFGGRSSGFILVSVDGEREPALTDRFNVSGFPTILFLDANGVEISRIQGYVSYSRFYSKMDAAYKDRDQEALRQKAVDQSPDGFRSNYEMASYYAKASQYAKARDYYWRAYRSEAGDQDRTGQMRRKALYNIAALSMRLEEYPLAASLWSAYVKTQQLQNSDLAYARYWRAVARLRGKAEPADLAEVREDLEYAVKHLPFDSERQDAEHWLGSLNSLKK